MYRRNASYVIDPNQLPTGNAMPEPGSTKLDLDGNPTSAACDLAKAFFWTTKPLRSIPACASGRAYARGKAKAQNGSRNRYRRRGKTGFGIKLV